MADPGRIPTKAAVARPYFQQLPGSHSIVCDTFEGFGDLPMDPGLDQLFAR
jgi:hypothetical protein